MNNKFRRILDTFNISSSLVIGGGGTIVYGITGYQFGKTITSFANDTTFSAVAGYTFGSIGAASKIGLNVVDVYFFLESIEKYILLRLNCIKTKNDDIPHFKLLLIPGFIISTLASISISHIAYKDLITIMAAAAIFAGLTTMITRVSIGTKSVSDFINDVPKAIKAAYEDPFNKLYWLNAAFVLTGLISSTIYFSDGLAGTELIFGKNNFEIVNILYALLAVASCLPTGLLQGKSLILGFKGFDREKLTPYNISMTILGILSTSFVCEVALTSLPGFFKYLVLPFAITGAAAANTRGLIELKTLFAKFIDSLTKTGDEEIIADKISDNTDSQISDEEDSIGLETVDEQQQLLSTNDNAVGYQSTDQLANGHLRESHAIIEATSTSQDSISSDTPKKPSPYNANRFFPGISVKSSEVNSVEQEFKRGYCGLL